MKIRARCFFNFFFMGIAGYCKPVEPNSPIVYSGFAVRAMNKQHCVTDCVYVVRFSESIFDEGEDHTYEMEYEQPKDDGCHAQVIFKTKIVLRLELQKMVMCNSGFTFYFCVQFPNS